MRLTHNPSFLRQAGIMIVVLAAIVAAAYVLDGARCALWAAGAGLATGVLFALFSALRSRQVMRLASEVDEVLHEGRRIDFSDYREGDLAILKNQLSKMVATLRDATMRLEKEKGALADALADVSHQIRTPLTAMGLLIGTAERTSDEAERIRALHELETLVSRVGWLVTALLKLAKADAGAIRVQARPVDAARLVRDALAPVSYTHLDVYKRQARAHLPRGVVPVRARHQRAAVVLRRHRRRLAPGHPREGQQLPGNARRHRDRRVRQDRHAHRPVSYTHLDRPHHHGDQRQRMPAHGGAALIRRRPLYGLACLNRHLAILPAPACAPPFGSCRG